MLPSSDKMQDLAARTPPVHAQSLTSIDVRARAVVRWGSPVAASSANRTAVLAQVRQSLSLVNRSVLQNLIERGIEQQPLSRSTCAVASIASDPTSGIGDIAEAIGSDPALALRVLRLANSARFARGAPVDSLKLAVQRIGVQETFRLAVSLALVKDFGTTRSSFFNYPLFWEHSYACGFLAEQLANACDVRNSSEAFLWGLLHDIGRLLLMEHAGQDYADALAMACELEMRNEYVEREVFGFTHCDIARRALEHWGFPLTCVAPICSHHATLAELRRGGKSAIPAALVALANRLAHALLLGASGSDGIAPIDDLCELLRLDAALLGPICTRTLDNVRVMRTTVAEATACTDGDADRPGPAKSPVHALCISDDARLDPFAIALRRIEDTALQQPNLGMLYIRRLTDVDLLLQRFFAAEKKAGESILPILVVCDVRKPQSDFGALRERSTVVLHTPVRVKRLFATIDDLLRPVA